MRMYRCHRTDSSFFQSQRSYGIFYAVIINFDSSVVYVSGKFWKERARIFDNFTHTAFRKHSKISILHPLFKFKYQRIGLTDTFFLTLFSSEPCIIGFRFYLVQFTNVVYCLCGQTPVLFQSIHVFFLTCAQQPARVIPFICSNCS